MLVNLYTYMTYTFNMFSADFSWTKAYILYITQAFNELRVPKKIILISVY